MLIQKPSTANPLIHHHIFFISFNHLFQQIAAATSMAPIFFGLASPLCACPRMKRDSPENVGKTDRTASQEERIVWVQVSEKWSAFWFWHLHDGRKESRFLELMDWWDTLQKWPMISIQNQMYQANLLHKCDANPPVHLVVASVQDVWIFLGPVLITEIQKHPGRLRFNKSCYFYSTCPAPDVPPASCDLKGLALCSILKGLTGLTLSPEIWRLEFQPPGALDFNNCHKCHGKGCRVLLGMGDLPPLIGILIMGI